MVAVMTDWIPRHRITVDEYYKMVEVGLLSPDSRVELIEGEIIDMPSIGSQHAGTVSQLTRLLINAVGELAIVSTQSPVRLSNLSEPQLDVALLKPRTDFYKSRHPTPADTLLIIEVSSTTIRYDTRVKVPLYARHQIPEVWVVDLEERQLRIFRSPSNGEYTDATVTKTPGVVTPHALDGGPIDLSHVLDD